MTFKEASTTCNLEGAHLLYLANEIEYDEVIAHNAPGMNIWMGFETNGTHIGRNVTGFDTPSDRIPRWANNEPAPNMHGVDCILVDYMKGLMVRACDELHLFFCKRRACLKGYMSCDTATKCVREVRKCDGKLHCLDTSDELDCPNDMNYIDVETIGNFSTRTLFSGQQRIWTMKAPIGLRIKLYVPSMTLETNVAFLEVWTGNSTFAVSRLIKKFTSTVSAGVYLYSDNNYMTVRLYANNLQQNFNTKTLSYTIDNTNIFLGYKDLDATVVLSPLIFPYQGLEYKPEGLHLRWRITAPGGDYITYYVEPIDKTKPTSGKIRGGMTYLEPGDVRVTGRNELLITMDVVPENLQLMYKSGCGGITLMHEYGTIHLFDEVIPNSAMCTWTLKGGEAVGRGLALKFMNDLYEDPRATFATRSMDFFMIEGSGGIETGVENYPAMIYHSSDGTFKVTFQSDVALNSMSFSIDFGADCPTLEVSEQTKMNKNTSYFNEDVVLTCPTGYDFHLEKYAHRESLNLICTKGSWYIDGEKLAAIPECRDVFCGIPPKVNNGHLVSATGAKYLSEATYACDPGFKIVEGTTGLCSNIGVWIHLPVCVAMGSNCSTLENCDTAILVCDVMTGTGVCQNGGLCTNGLETASCECKSDYDVRRCYFDEGRVGIAGGTETLDFIQVQSLDECKSRCLNNPNCGDMVFVTSSGQFHCFLYEREKFVSTSDESTRVHYRRICPTDYTGDSCEQVKDWCSEGNNPCENGGECTPKGPVGYMCMCKPGFSGVTCNIDADPCGTNPCAGVARCQSTVTEYICQCEQGKIFTGSQCRDDPTRPVILVNNLYGVLDAPTLQTPFRWINKTISIMFMIRVHASSDHELASLLNIYVQNSLNPNYQDYMYWISVSRRGIGIKTNMSPWLGVTFNEDFGSELGDGSWHHLGIAINENGMLSATLDAITIDDAVEVVSPPAGEKNVQISLGYLNLAEYQDVSIWDVTLTSRDFALASVGTQPSVNPIQGWWNYDPKTSGMRLTERLLHNLLDDPNINFPQMNCDGFENIMHVSAEGVVDRDTFVGKIEEVKENTNGTLTFKHSLPPSLTWGFYETVIVGMNSNTLNYGECRVQLVVKYNDECPAARSDDTQRKVCPSGADAVCDLACLDTNEALFAPVPKYISCGTLGVWDTREPYEDLVLPGCTISRDPRYAVTIMMKFEAVIHCRNLNINTAVTDRLNDMLMNDINGEKWTGLCTGANCDNLEITKAACIDNTKMFEVEFTLTFASNTITAVGGGETSVLDALRIIILLEKDLSLKEIAEASLLEDTVEISMEEVCGVGYALVMSDKSRACVPCGPGWRYDLEAKECVLCDYGHYQNGFVQTECIPCGNGKSTNFRGAREENDCIVTCEAGTYYDVDEEQCVDCKRHYFQNMTGQDYCFPCPLGYKTVGNRSTSIAACTEDCLPGYVRNPQNLTECVRCKRGTFRSTQDDCVPCTDGKYTLEDTIAMDSSNCDMDICDLGEFWNVSASNCQKCDLGYYQNEMYQLQCKMCASDYSTRDMSAQNDSFCEFFCPVGEELMDGTNCASCERGFFKDNVGLNKFNPCQECSTEKTTETTGSTSESNCSIHKCGPGEISTENGCVECPIDTYQSMDHPYSSIECQLCQKDGIFETGTIAAGVSNSDECKPFCSSGYIINAESTGCDPCSRGLYKNNEDSRFSAECNGCPVGTTTEDMASTHRDNCSIQEERSSLAVIIGTSVAGGLLLMVVVSFLIYRRRKRNEKLPEEGRSDRTDTSNPMNVYDQPQVGENDIPTSKNEYDVIPADVNVYMTVTEDAQTSTGTNESSIHVPNTDTTTSERNIYSELDVNSLNDKDKDYLRLYSHDSHGYLAPIQLGNISHNRNEEGRNSTSFL
ncbi:uncharacterized protein LOC128225235 isoform X2 [Mya arenaria]|nr:uncharacterized protein LOC128225235 isoform X2 [Mya arenaria]